MIDESELRQRLGRALPVRRWVDDVAARAPYRDLDELLEAARSAATPLTDAELDEALAAPRRQDDRSAPTGVFGRLSHGGQDELDRAAEGPDAALAKGARVYEERFGRPLALRAAGMSSEQLADEVQRRLKNDPVDEAEEAKEQLRPIAELRLTALFTEEETR